MKKTKISNYLLVVVMISVFSCTKEGAIGPQGPAGQNGVNGNANISVAPFSYLWKSSDFPISSKILDNNVPAITQANIDNGVIIGYLSFDGTTWYPLPYFKVLASNIQINFRPTITVGHYQVEILRNDGFSISQNQLGGSSTIYFKIVTMSK